MKNISQILNPIEISYYEQNFQEIWQREITVREKINLFNPFFLSLINILVEKQETPIFAGWYAKINFVIQAYGLATAEEEKIQALRRFFRRNAVQKRWQPSEREGRACLKLLFDFLDFFALNKTPKNDFYIKNLHEAEETLLLKTDAPQKIITLLEGVIVKTGTTQKEGQREIWCDTEQYGTVKIILQDIRYSAKYTHNITKNADYLRKSQSINLTHLEWVVEENYYISTEETLLIAQPDYLVDVSEIAKSAESCGSPYLSLLSLLKFFEGSEHTFLGNMINDMLDRVVINPEISFDDAFQKTFAEKSIEAVSYEYDKLSQMPAVLAPQFNIVKNVIHRYKDASLLTEPSFISPKYGLQGRLDVLIDYPQQNTRKDIIELKSVKGFPSHESGLMARNADLIQVACYNLLIETTYPNRNGVSAILYARDEKTPLRDCGKLNFEKQKAMAYRNRIVSLHWELAMGNKRVFEQVYQNLVKCNIPDFYSKEAKAFQEKWNSASEVEKVYFVEFLALVARERFAAKIGGVYGTEISEGFAGIWKEDLQAKQQKFQIFAYLKLISVDFENLELIFQKTANTQEITTFREEDIVLLYPQETENTINPLQYQLLQGSITLLSPEKIRVKLWTRFIDKHFLEKYQFWSLEPNLMENSFRYMTASLAEFLGATQEKKDLLLGKTPPTFDESFVIDFTERGLSEEQSQILNRALSAKDYFLLQGPPGTGKTSQMLRNMVAYLYDNTEETIVLLAFTNRATDEICEKITSVCQGKFIRLGNVTADSNYREQSLKGEPDVLKLKEKLHSTRIFVSTVASFYKFFHLIPKKNTLIVDEASQLLEPHLAGILPMFERFILIGDEKQMPAVITQSVKTLKTSQNLLQKIGIENLGVSIFERLLNNAMLKGWDKAYAMLSVQYRTHEGIANFISKIFYKTLRIGSLRQKSPWQLFNPQSNEPTERWLAQGRILFENLPTEKTLKVHKAEAKRVAEILETIRNVYHQQNLIFHENTVGVITPYRAQIAEIYQYLDEELRQKVTVDTVERYQGSERDIIIVSMAVNHAIQLQNLQAFNLEETVDKKLNVTLSRAKEQFILLGNDEILQEGKFYAELLRYIRAKNNP